MKPCDENGKILTVDGNSSHDYYLRPEGDATSPINTSKDKFWCLLCYNNDAKQLRKGRWANDEISRLVKACEDGASSMAGSCCCWHANVCAG